MIQFAPFGASGGGIPVSMRQFIPANGLAGFAQQTPAVQALYRSGRTSGGRRRRTAKKKAAGVKRVAKRAKSRTKSTAKRFVKGSAAAKRHMAKIRKMRKR
jgi:hypothetical protein